MFNYTSGGLFSLTKYLPSEIRNYLQQENWSEFQDEIENRLLMYYDDWKDLLKDHIKSKLSRESQDHFFPHNRSAKWPLPIHINILQRVVDEISLLYKNQANRAFVYELLPEPDQAIDGQQQEDVKAIEEMDERGADIFDIRYNSMLQTVNKMTNICNVCVVMVSPDEKEKCGLRYDILTPDMYTPIQDPDNPNRLIGIIYAIDSADTPGGFTTIRKEVIYYIGRSEDPNDEPFYAICESGLQKMEKTEKLDYPYYYENEPFLPFITFRNSYPVAGEYVNRTQGDGLYQASLHTADLISRYMRAIEDQTMKQLAIVGGSSRDVPPAIFRDQLAILSFPFPDDQTSIQMLDFQIDIKSMWESILNFIESSIAGYGLSIDKFKSTPQSGLSIKLSNQQLINKIQDQQPFFYAAERELADVIRKINNSMLPAGEFGKITDNADFRIDFGQLPFEPDPIELSEKYLALIDANVLSVPEYIQKLDPELSFADALEKFERNKEINKKRAPTLNLNELAGMDDALPESVEQLDEDNEIEEPEI